ncbi:hypothetical protein LZ30DRAFT_636071 [Colletotrichum cereale]|nr:hypothetical protein LZ30DRAFT_636071 [Colletotrichum cereale]
MSRHSENCSTAAAYAERVFQQLEDNRPSDAPDDFSSPSPKEPTPGKPEATCQQAQPVRSNTVESFDVYAQSKTASYEARSRRTEELALETARREREAAATARTPPRAGTPVAQQETSFFCPACIADDEKEWITAADADLDS